MSKTHTRPKSRKPIDVKLSIIIFKEDDAHIVFCPALNLTGYGDTEHEAMQSFEVVLGEYFSYTMNKKSLEADLRKIGWNIRKTLRKPATPPDMAYLLSNNDDFRNVFNNYAYRKEDTQISIPAFA